MKNKFLWIVFLIIFKIHTLLAVDLNSLFSVEDSYNNEYYTKYRFVPALPLITLVAPSAEVISGAVATAWAIILTIHQMKMNIEQINMNQIEKIIKEVKLEKVEIKKVEKKETLEYHIEIDK